MRIKELSKLHDLPKWLLQAQVENEDIEFVNGTVTWKNGIFPNQETEL